MKNSDNYGWFCYSCFTFERSRECSICGDTGIMKMHSDGPEYFDHELDVDHEKCFDLEREFEKYIYDKYNRNVNAGFMKLDLVDVMKTMDEACWEQEMQFWKIKLINEGKLLETSSGILLKVSP